MVESKIAGENNKVSADGDENDPIKTPSEPIHENLESKFSALTIDHQKDCIFLVLQEKELYFKFTKTPIEESLSNRDVYESEQFFSQRNENELKLRLSLGGDSGTDDEKSLMIEDRKVEFVKSYANKESTFFVVKAENFPWISLMTGSHSVDSLLEYHQESSAVSNKEKHTALISKLQDPICKPIIKQIKRILKYLLMYNVAVEEKSKLSQRFYSEVGKELAMNGLWKGSEQVHEALDHLEGYVLGKSHSFIFQQSDDRVQDDILVERLDALRAIPTTKLFPKASERIEADPKSLLMVDFKDLDSLSCPKEKIGWFVQLLKVIGEEKLNGDDLIPLLTALLIKEKPSHLISHIRHIQRFRNHARLSGQYAFCLTNIIASVSTVEGLWEEFCGSTKSTDTIGSNVLHAIGFVPRAIGSAVVDTFKSRSSSKETSSKPASHTSQTISPLFTQAPTSLFLDSGSDRLVLLRRRLVNDVVFDEFSVGDLKCMIGDYKAILKSISEQ